MKTLCIDFRMHKFSGIGRYITNIVPLLIENFNITLLGSKKEIFSSYEWSQRVSIIECNAKIYSIKEQIELFSKIPRCDIFWSPHYNIPILPIAANKRVVTIHDVFHLAFQDTLSLPQKLYANLVLNAALKRSDAVLTVSNFSKNEIYKYISTKKQINVVPCGVNASVLNNANAQYDFEYILYVGNIKPHKNLERSILAYKALGQSLRHIKFVIVGKKENFLNGDIKSLLMADNNIIFTGHIDDYKLNDLYKNAKMLLFASLYEGFGLPPIEAMAYGCPCLVSNIASLPEVCEDCAIYCDPYNVDDITDKLGILLTNKELHTNLITKGYENVKRFSWEKSARQITQILNEL